MRQKSKSWDWKRLFWQVIAFSLLLRLFVAWKLPLTGDEAYYVFWGKHPALGYYDQAPMIGWVMALMESIGQWIGGGAASSPLFLRLPVILLPLVLAPVLVSLARRWDASGRSDQAYLVGCLFLLAPVDLLIPVLSTDLPLILFSVLCFYFYFRAIEEDRLGLAGLAGVFFGLAFLSKYFVLFLGAAFLVFSVLFFRETRTWLKLGVGVLAALPFLALHWFWNSQNCWVNFYFNTTSRNTFEEFSIYKVIEFVVFQVMIVGPVVLYFLWKSRRRLGESAQKPSQKLAWVCYLVPILAFGLTSFKYRQGLHWTLSFYPFFFLVFGSVLASSDIKSVFRWSVLWSGALTLFWLGVLCTPVDFWQGRAFYPGLKMYLAAPALSQVMNDYRDRYVLASDGYTEAALLEVNLPTRVHVFGEGSVFGRQDDLLTRWSELEHRDFAILSRHSRTADDFRSYFRSVEERLLEVQGRTYHIFLGYDFRLDLYRKEVLTPAFQKYYLPSCGVIQAHF